MYFYWREILNKTIFKTIGPTQRGYKIIQILFWKALHIAIGGVLISPDHQITWSQRFIKFLFIARI